MPFDAERINSKFGLLALDDCLEVDLGVVVDAGNGVSFHPTCQLRFPTIGESGWGLWRLAISMMPI